MPSTYIENGGYNYDRLTFDCNSTEIFVWQNCRPTVDQSLQASHRSATPTRLARDSLKLGLEKLDFSCKK